MKTHPSILTSFITLWISLGSVPFLKAAEEIPFRLYRDHMVLAKGAIGPLDDLTFLIDTGATSTAINPHIAKQLKVGGTVTKAASYSGEVTCKLAVLHDIRLGTREFDFIPTLITDFSALGTIGNHIDAIIGMNLLKRTNFRIDYTAKTLSFAPSDQLPNSTTLDCPELSPVITMRVMGRAVRLLVDTGAKDLFLFKERLQDFPKATTRRFRKTVHHLGSTEEVQGVLLEEVRLGSSGWDHLSAFLLDSSISKYDGLEGITGIAALGLSCIQFDFPNQQFSWAR